MDIKELKALAYDLLIQRSLVDQKLQAVGQEIAKKEQEELKPETEKIEG